MFRPTSPQGSLLETRFLVPPKKRALLERSWAQVFNERVLPIIDEEVFRDAFDQGNGRPNKSIRLLVGLHLLKEWDDLTDEQVLEQLEFNLLWQHALGVEPSEAHTCQKTLHNFRVKLMGDDRAQEMFDRVTRRLVEADRLTVSRQRLDSTHVMSNIAVLTRLGLFVETITVFLKALRKGAPERVAALPAGYRERYLDREGYFSDAKREVARRRLPIVAQDLCNLVGVFAQDTEICGWTSYQAMERLLLEQCEVLDEDGGAGGEGGEAGAPTKIKRLRLKEGKEITGRSLQSPHDPDATYGHKGKGYETQLAETCGDTNPYQVITGVALNGAHESDQKATVPMVEDLIARGLGPKELLADTGYGSGENIVACGELGVDLVAPVQNPGAAPSPDAWSAPVEAGASVCADETGKEQGADAQSSEQQQVGKPPQEEQSSAVETPAAEKLGLDAFQFNTEYDEVVSCPAGHAPSRNEILDTNPPFKATFDSTRCEGCPLSDRCPTRMHPNGERSIRWRDARAATESRQREQQEKAFKERYRLRSGIESTNAELKGRHGMRKLRVRGRKRTQAAVRLKALALNTKRAVFHHTRERAKARQGTDG